MKAHKGIEHSSTGAQFGTPDPQSREELLHGKFGTK